MRCGDCIVLTKAAVCYRPREHILSVYWTNLIIYKNFWAEVSVLEKKNTEDASKCEQISDHSLVVWSCMSVFRPHFLKIDAVHFHELPETSAGVYFDQ